MSLRLRLSLALLGLGLFCLAATTVVYRLWPMGVNREDFRPAPTLFAPPAGSTSGSEAA